MELQKLISEKKKSGIGNKRESVDLTGGNFGEGQPSCYRSIKQPSFGLFFCHLRWLGKLNEASWHENNGCKALENTFLSAFENNQN